jgi:hypothetical protein
MPTLELFNLPAPTLPGPMSHVVSPYGSINPAFLQMKYTSRHLVSACRSTSIYALEPRTLLSNRLLAYRFRW